MRFLRTNTAVIVTVGPFFDATDGVTIENSLTITNERISFVVDSNAGSAPTLVLDNVTGATSGTDNDLNYITGADAGLMQLELSAANTNYVGRALLTVTDAANHVPVFHEFMILPAVVFDSLIAGSDTLHADVTQFGGTNLTASGGRPEVNTSHVSGTAQTARDLGASVLLSSGTGTGQVSLSSGTVTVGTNNDKTGYGLADGAITAAKFAAGAIDAAAIAADAIGASELAADAASEIGTAVWATATRVLTANTNLNDPTAAAIADAVWDEALSGHTGSGSAGEALAAAGTAGDPWTTALPGSYGSGTAGNILGNRLVGTLASGTHTAQSGDTYARLGAPAGASVSADVAAVKSDTAAILDDTGTSGVVVAAGSKTGYSLTATTGLGNQTANITGNLSGSVGSVTGAVGSVTGNVGGNVAGSVASVTGAVGSVTGNVGGNVAGSVASVTGAVGSVTGNVGGNVTGSVGSVAAGGITAASLATDAITADKIAADAIGSSELAATAATEIATAVWAVVGAEPGSVPALNAALSAKIDWIFALARNKITQTATTQALRNDADSANLATAAVSDDGTTFVRGEWS